MGLARGEEVGAATCWMEARSVAVSEEGDAKSVAVGEEAVVGEGNSERESAAVVSE